VTLDELAALGLPGATTGVPTWSLGCFRRRSITFFSGVTDSQTVVYWLQAGNLTVDLRLPARRSSLALAEALARTEGGLARARWDGRAMTWSDWTSFQLHDRWPEPGLLARVGDCLIEHAPSGAYVEDWRLQPSADGPLVGLRLVDERDRDSGEVRHVGGGLVVCGQHAALVLGRPRPLPSDARLEELVKAHPDDPQLLRAIRSCEVSYASCGAGGGPFVITASTDPAREGQPLAATDGFSWDEGNRHALQRLQIDGRRVERRFTVDTLVGGFGFYMSTAAAPEARAWLERETVGLGLAPPDGRA
jgi:hypothetical protein